MLEPGHRRRNRQRRQRGRGQCQRRFLRRIRHFHRRVGLCTPESDDFGELSHELLCGAFGGTVQMRRAAMRFVPEWT